MPILIPSKNIYRKQNQKVRDNVIERIEVSAQEVLTDNEYGVSVYNKRFELTSDSKIEEITENYDSYTHSVSSSAGGYTASAYATAFAAYTAQKVFGTKILVNVLSDNHWVKKLMVGEKTDEYNNKENNIKHTLYGITKKGKCSSKSTLASEVIDNIIYDVPTEESEGVSHIELPKEISWEEVFKNSGFVSTPHATIEVALKDLGNLSAVSYEKILIDGKEFYSLDIKVLCDLRTIGMGRHGTSNTTETGSLTGFSTDYEGEYIDYISTALEITINGDTIGIDLTDKTVYINGETAKKVHSVSGNELMQTTNYFIDKDGVKHNAIEYAFSNVQAKYKDGKETATIRCDISDYYDYDTKKKVICIKNSTGKMSFKEYDQVIPMVFGADGKDKPMSLYSDGSPKIFQVLGTKICYDGAVWQELSLQEIDKSEIK
jgi:hypothetical protein